MIVAKLKIDKVVDVDQILNKVVKEKKNVDLSTFYKRKISAVDKEIYIYSFECVVVKNSIRENAYSLECSYVSEFLPIEKIEERKFAEAFVVVANLLNENIEDNEHRYPKYLYKKYLKALKYYINELKLSEDFVEKTMLDYLEKEYEGKNNKSLKLAFERSQK